jgi:hypothetical protein
MKTRPPLVYIANQGLHDYSSAHKWTPLGENGVVKVTSGDIDRRNPMRLVNNIVDGLKNFTEHDYFVFSGSPIPFALGLAYLFMKQEQVNVLFYLRSKNEYFNICYTKDMFLKAGENQYKTAEEIEAFLGGYIQ